MWDLSEIPCKHVVCAIWAHREQPEQYVLLCYSRDFYLTTYSFIIHLVPTHHEWVISELKKIQPPHYHKPTGRPRKQRRKAIDEPKNPHKSSRKNLTVTCARCLTTGHNSRACKLPPHPDSKLFKSIGGFDGAGTSHGVGSSHGSAKLKAKIGSKSKQLRKSNAGKKTTKSQVSSQLTGGTLLGKRPICSSSPPFSNRGNFQSRWNPVGEAEMWTASKPSLSSQPPSNANKKTSSQPGSSSQPPPTGSKKKAASSNKSPTKGCLGLTRRGGKGIRGGN